MPTWISLAKRRRDARVFLIDAKRSDDGSTLVAGLGFINADTRSRFLTLRCVETKERVKIELPDEVRRVPLPRCYLRLDLEVKHG